MPVPEGAEYTVVVAHADASVRTAVSAELSGADELSVVGETGGGLETIEQVLDQVPDAVVIGLGFDDEPAEVVVQRIRDAVPVTVAIAVLSDEPDDGSDDDQAYPLARAGVLSTLRLGAPPTAVDVVRGAIQGESILPPRWAERAADDLRLLEDEPLIRPPALSSTEVEVLERLAKNEAPADIAVEYDVSERLVNLHTGYALAKLHWGLDELRHLAALDG